MAKKIVLVDDFDGEPASETVVFGLDGEAWSIDLSEEHAEELRAAIAPYQKVATRIGRFKPERRARSAASSRSSPPSNGRSWYKSDRSGSRQVERAKKEYRDRVKEWGRKNGYKVGQRGVVADEVYHAYEEHLRKKGLPTGPAAVGLT
ncbi:Lsr2 protein [Amycolatopsis arida]|uniref:Lsr2 protein n=1 Tax=Amycolatopsis arida TaxID=587909 RepID=A0A1I5KA71_9PSEU|nr:Lsr2 family protein [Amycolatopsis arida]TDX96957.1 Lsr2 protein [Amycolatopsis arida]SFO81919.1 Lsr2 protein [Amycolatopsis arida]